jgi:hypothetical protein
MSNSKVTVTVLGKVLQLVSDLVNIFSKTEEPNIVDDTGVGGIIYLGYAVPGTLVADAKWKIKKVTEVGTITTIQYADNNLNFDNVWANRASLIYV